MLNLRNAFDDPLRQRTIRALSHPLTLAAVIVLLVNDHILRVTWPSWITGKLGDFAWLAFFPLTLAAPLAWIIPSRFESRRAIIPALAFGITAALFISMKTLPAALDAGLWLLSQITGGPFTLRLDPTDLITLSGLAVGWWVWKRAETPVPASRGWVVLALGALATIANLPPPPAPIIYCLVLGEDDIVYAVASGNDFYASHDGGLTWESYAKGRALAELNFYQTKPCDRGDVWPPEIVIVQPEAQDALIRVSSEKAERSIDGGSTWVLELDLTHTEAERMNFDREQLGINYFIGPTDAVIDSQTGNLIVAYGIEGVLVRSPDGVWTRAAVGDFKPMEKMDSVGIAINLLGGHIILAVPLFMLMAATIQIWTRRHHWILIPLYILTWLCWAYFDLAIIGGEASNLGLFSPIVLPIALILFIVIMIHVATTITPGREPRRVKWIAGAVAIPLYLLPYIFWTQGVIPTYTTATMFSLTLIACVLFGAILESHPEPPEPKPEERPPHGEMKL